MSALRPRQLPDHLLSRGVSSFTVGEAQVLLGASHPSTLRTLGRLHLAGQVFSPARGFYVVIPPEFRTWRVVPGELFIDAMMDASGRTYYVALLSAAAMHGASHQAPQVFQVMCAPPLADRDVERVRLRFFSGAHVADAPTVARNVSTGRVRIATKELTVIDLVDRPDAGAGLNNVATILHEIGDLDGQALADLARRRGRTLVRRVGWMVERFGSCESLDPLRHAAELDRGEPVLLRAGAARRGAADPRWGVRVNTAVEQDL